MRRAERRGRCDSVGLRTSILIGALATTSCVADPSPGPPGTADAPEIADVESPRPVLEGSLLVVTGLGFDLLADDARLEVSSGDGSFLLLQEGPAGSNERSFLVTRDLVDGLGVGEHGLTAIIGDGRVESTSFPFVIDVARDLPVRLDDAPSGDVHRNDLWLVSGDGLLAEQEGLVDARFTGTFTPDSGAAPVAIDVPLPVLPAERFSRTRGIVRLTTALGGLEPGTFEGTVTLEQAPRGGTSTSSRAVAVALRFQLPELFAVEPPVATLEQVVTVRGAGFLGGADEPDEATLIRLQGAFHPQGGAEMSFGPAELVLQWVSGSEVRGVLRAVVRDGELVSEIFGARRGVFRGTATPVVIKGTEELEGASVPFELTLGPVRQVVYLRFLPGFYDSLTRFGLAAAAGEIEVRVKQRIELIYERWLVDVRLVEPPDFSRNGYVTLEIGGPDPNGIGLFGYDNTPGKDVGNLRLYDAIGGTNAETQEDMYPGYGGVFVESFLFFSSHPDLPGDTPTGVPEPDPLFDQIFDPVRRQAATLAEVRGEGGRIAVVERALRSLASIIGETAAHELGHSLGLANPHGPMTAYHNDSDDEGCLMDSGGARPLGERADEPDYAPTRLCYDAPAYLDALHGP